MSHTYVRALYIYGEDYHNYVGASTSVQFTRDLSLQIKMEVIFHELFFIEVSLVFAATTRKTN